MRTIKALMELDGKVAIVTGGTGHIGKVLCQTLAELKADVVVCDVDKTNCEILSHEISNNYGVEAVSIVADLSNTSQIRSIAPKVVDHYGRIDILVNCAAFVGTSKLLGWIDPFLQQSDETWRKAFEVNLTAIFILIQECVPALKKAGNGSIINIASVYGIVGPYMGLYEGTGMGNPAAYAASKGGLIHFTRWLSTVLAPEIRVNSISPGGVQRDQPAIFQERYNERTPLKRMATEEDLKGALAYLASDLSSYVTGQNIVVDGGFSVW